MEAVPKVALCTSKVVFALLVIITLTSPQPTAAGSSSSWPAAPFSESYLAVWTDFPEYETFDRIRIHVRSELVSNETGNATARASGNPINVTLYAEDLDLVVYRTVSQLFLGNATVIANVVPEWTTSRIQVIVEDSTAGLVNDTARFKTVMSWDYFLYLTAQEEYTDDLRDREVLQARIDLVTNMALWTVGSMMVALFVIFLRTDHRRSRRVNAPSLWDRFSKRVWPYSWTMDEAYALLEDPDTWAPETAERFRDFRKEAHIRKLKEQAKEIRAEAKAILEGRLRV